MHAVGHALLAFAAGSAMAALAQRWGAPAATAHGLGGVGGLCAGGGGGAQARDLANEALLWSEVGLAVVFAKAISGAYATYVQGRIAGDVGALLRLELLDALLSVHALRRPRHDDHGKEGGDASLVSAAGRPPGDRAEGIFAEGVASLTERVNDVEVGLKLGFLGGLRAVAQLVPLAVVLAVLSARTAAAAVLVMGTFGVILARVRAGYRKALATASRERTRLLEAADEAVRHAELWVSYGAEEKARGRVARLGEAIAAGAARLDARAAAMSGANEVLGAAALVVAIAASRAPWLGPAPDGATLLAFAVAFFLAYKPVRELSDARLSLERARSAFEELAPVLRRGSPRAAPVATARAEARTQGVPVTPPRAWAPGLLAVRGLKLARGACAPVTMRVEPGSIAVITGPTGVGKTTLLRTLLGFERALGGEVFFDGLALGDAPAGPAGRPFAWVPQDAPLVADTLEGNVALGLAPGASGRPVREALEPPGAGHLADALGGARLVPGGRVVSGGERQWIALARAIATGQPVLLLDEPTSGMDPGSQRRVLDSVARLRGRRTVLLVTHRAEPLAIADQVIHLGPATPKLALGSPPPRDCRA